MKFVRSLLFANIAFESFLFMYIFNMQVSIRDKPKLSWIFSFMNISDMHFQTSNYNNSSFHMRIESNRNDKIILIKSFFSKRDTKNKNLKMSITQNLRSI